MRPLRKAVQILLALAVAGAVTSCSSPTSTTPQTSIGATAAPPNSLGSACDLTAGIDTSLADLGAGSFRAGLRSGNFDVCTATTVDGRDLVAISLSDEPLTAEQLRLNKTRFDTGQAAGVPLDWGEIEAYVESNEPSEGSIPVATVRLSYRFGNTYGSVHWTGANMPTFAKLEAFVRDLLERHG